MIVIGITGGIASGKSTIAKMLAGSHLPHIDADQLVHHLLRCDQPTIAEIAAHFPSAIQDGVAVRKLLGVAIAGDENKLNILEEILHPRVRREEERALLISMRQRRRAVILEVPLMFETGADELCDIVIAVTAPVALRRRRAMSRLHMKPETFDRLIARQLTDRERNARADLVLPSTLGLAYTRRQIARLKKQWKI
jgi:dephospho-CoA kinase